MFSKEGEYDIRGSWNIQDLLKNENNENESNNKVAKNFEKFKRSNSREKADIALDSLDNEIANRIIKDLHNEGAFKSIDNLKIR